MAAPGDRSFVGLLEDIAGSLREIIRLELRLARAEMTESAMAMRRGMVIVAVGAAVLLFSVAFLLLALVYLLATVMSPWLASLIVGGSAAVIGTVCVRVGVSRLQGVHLPRRTLASIQENLPWPTAQTR